MRNLQEAESRLEEILGRGRETVEVVPIRPFPCRCHVTGAFCEQHGSFDPVLPTVYPPRVPTTGGGRRIIHKKLAE